MPARNKVFMLGNLTRDPELKYTPNKTAVCDFGLAVNRKWTGNDGRKRESVCFIEVKCYGTQAENCSKYLAKGRLVDVEGRLDFEQWDGKDDQKHRRHVLVADDVQFLPNGKHTREPGEEG